MAPILAAIASMFAKEGLGLLAGAIAGGKEKAVEFISEKTGIDIKDVADPKTDTHLTTEHIEALKTLESTDRIELAKLAYADVADARRREVEIVKATGEKETNLYVMAWLTVVGFFACVVIALLVDFPEGESAKAVLAMLFGALVTSYKDVIGYFFGGSKDGSDMTKRLKQ